jgi:N-methylhydantoinase A
VLVAFGGAGGLHVCELADALGMRRALAPRQAGVLSALGMLAAPRGRQLSQTLGCPLADCSQDQVTGVLTDLRAGGHQALAAEGIEVHTLAEQVSLDLCYRGQGHSLNIPGCDLQQAESAFHQAHEQQFGHRLAAPVELVNVRLGLRSRTEAPQLPLHTTRTSAVTRYSTVHGYQQPVPVLARESIQAGPLQPGPLILCDSDSTTFIPHGWQGEIDSHGNIVLHKPPGGDAQH